MIDIRVQSGVTARIDVRFVRKVFHFEGMIDGVHTETVDTFLQPKSDDIFQFLFDFWMPEV
jgi:hypothetical protein